MLIKLDRDCETQEYDSITYFDCFEGFQKYS